LADISPNVISRSFASGFARENLAMSSGWDLCRRKVRRALLKGFPFKSWPDWLATNANPPSTSSPRLKSGKYQWRFGSLRSANRFPFRELTSGRLAGRGGLMLITGHATRMGPRSVTGLTAVGPAQRMLFFAKNSFTYVFPQERD
jgi:hypothetical protein